MCVLIDYNLDLNNRPETYKTILGEEYGKNTETFKLRRKMNIAIKDGKVCFKTIDIINKGKDRIFYTIQKEYFVVYTKKTCYYCDNVNSKNNTLYMKNARELNCVKWLDKKDLTIDISEVIVCF